MPFPPTVQDIKEESDDMNETTDLSALKEHIGPGITPQQKVCKICNTQRNGKRIENHVTLCLKYYDQVLKDDENSEKFSCKLCSKSFDLIGSLYNHLEKTNHKDLNPLRDIP